MYDAATVLLREYYRATGWNEQQSYTHLMSACSGLVDFAIPNGVLLSSAATKTPTMVSSARLLTVPLSGAVGYTYVAAHMPFDTACVQRSARRMTYGAQFLTPDTPFAFDGVPLAAPSRDARDMLLYGCFHVPSTYAEGVAAMRIAPHWQLLATALSRAPRYPLLPLAKRLGLVAPGPVPDTTQDEVGPPGTTNLQLALQMQTDKTTAEYSYSIDDALWGLRVLRTLTPPASLGDGTLSAGAEAFFSAAEKSAGLSLGLRYAQRPVYGAGGRVLSFPAVSSATLNPMMGHVRYAYAAQVDEDLALCARYDMNVYSYLSDLTLGAEYCLRSAPAEERHEAQGSLRERVGVWAAPLTDAALSLRESVEAWSEGEGPKPDAAHAAVATEAPDTHAVAAAEPAALPLGPRQPPLQGLFKLRMSASGLLALLWEGHWNHCLVSVGLQTQLALRPTLAATSTLGAEFVYVDES